MKVFVLSMEERIDCETTIFNIIYVSTESIKMQEYISKIAENRFNSGEYSFELQIWQESVREVTYSVENNYFDLEAKLQRIAKNEQLLIYLFNTSEGKMDKEYLQQTIEFINSL